MFDDYKEIPLKIFIKVLNDEKRLSELLPDLDAKKWTSFKDDFEAEYPSIDNEFRIEKQQKVLYPESKLKLYSTLVKFCFSAPEKWEELFDAAEVTKKATLLESVESVNKMMAKEQVRLNISKAELEKYLEENPIEEDGEGAEKYNIFDVLSSLSSVTGNKLDYNTATIGELLAEQKLASRMAEKSPNNGG